VQPQPDVPAPARARTVSRWWHGHYGRALLHELAVIATVYGAYKWVRFLVRDQVDLAFANAREVIDVERSVGLFTELDVQGLALRSDRVIHGLNWFYAHAHMWTTIAVLILMYVTHPVTYRWLRRLMVGVTLVALFLHMTYPLAPPRMLDGLGFVDTLDRYGPSIYGEGSALAELSNQYAAMPSLHFGYAVMLTWALARTMSTRWRYLLAAHPLLMLVTIVATANHYWLDAIVCAVVIAGVATALRAADHRSLSVTGDDGAIGTRPGEMSPAT